MNRYGYKFNNMNEASGLCGASTGTLADPNQYVYTLILNNDTLKTGFLKVSDPNFHDASNKKGFICEQDGKHSNDLHR